MSARTAIGNKKKPKANQRHGPRPMIAASFATNAPQITARQVFRSSDGVLIGRSVIE